MAKEPVEDPPHRASQMQGRIGDSETDAILAHVRLGAMVEVGLDDRDVSALVPPRHVRKGAFQNEGDLGAFVRMRRHATSAADPQKRGFAPLIA